MTGGAAVAELARRLAAQRPAVVDVDELVALIEATGVHDRAAAQRYGLPGVFALAEAVLAHLRQESGGTARAPAAPSRPEPARRYAARALARCLLFLAPALPVAAAVTAGPAEQLRWPAVAGLLGLGWAGAQALGYLGRVTAARRGPGPATRPRAAGYAALLALWWLLAAAAPAALLGPQRLPGQLIGAAALAGLSAATAAAVTGSHAAVLAATAPSAALAAAASAGALPGRWPVPVALLACAAVPVLVAYRPAGRPAAGPGGRLRGRDLGRGALHLAAGLGQALAVVLLWRSVAGPPPAPWALGGPGWLLAIGPALLAVPLVELLVGWYTARMAAALDGYDVRADFRRHARRLALHVVALLLPGLCTGVVLAAAGYRLPYHLDAHPQVRAGALALAGGVLLGVGFGLVRLLAARRRPGVAAVVAAAPFVLSLGAHHAAPAGWVACAAPCLPGLATPLPLAVGALFAACLIGLAATGYVLYDHRGHR